jgi:hypothetical protein
MPATEPSPVQLDATRTVFITRDVFIEAAASIVSTNHAPSTQATSTSP